MKTVAIIGATGQQGSSVLKAFAPTYNIRAITRDPTSARAKSLLSISPNITLVQADTSSVESLVSAFRGADIIYGVTDYWAPFSSPSDREQHYVGPEPGESLRKFAFEREIQHGKNIAIAAAKIVAETPSFERFIWSGLPSPDTVSNGKYKGIYHFESKAVVTEYIRTEHPSLSAKTSIFIAGFYVSNMIQMKVMWPVKRRDGSFVVQRLCDGSVKMPFIIADETTGPLVKALVETGKPGTILLGYTAMASWAELTDLWGQATGQKVEFEQVTLEEFSKHFPVEGAELLSAPYAAEFGFVGRSGGFVEPADLGVRTSKEYIAAWYRVRNSREVIKQAPRH